MALALGANHQTQAVVAVDGCDAVFLADDSDVGAWIDPAQLEHFEVSVQARDAMRVDAPQIACCQNIRRLRRIFCRNAEVHEYRRRKIFQIVRGENIGRLIIEHAENTVLAIRFRLTLRNILMSMY